ncbi:MAG: hypothetical protein GXO62_04420 [Epsilonproteobacteria bacterium]|nr:hypothetical protein [Campylobacterota bacterium]
MPLNISKVGKVLKALNRVNFTEFNATLPVKLEVKKEINPITYLIKLGNKEMETKSYKPLEIGKKYIAQIKEAKNQIIIQNLKEMPSLSEILEKVDLKKGLSEYKKEDVLNQLQHAKTKDEFMFFANILLAMDKKIYHLSISDERKKALMQYKLNKNKVSFYAVFSNLGEISGTISPSSATLVTEYPNVAALINQYKEELDMNIEVILKEVKPLYEFTNSLLDLKA